MLCKEVSLNFGDFFPLETYATDMIPVTSLQHMTELLSHFAYQSIQNLALTTANIMDTLNGHMCTANVTLYDPDTNSLVYSRWQSPVLSNMPFIFKEIMFPSDAHPQRQQQRHAPEDKAVSFEDVADDPSFSHNPVAGSVYPHDYLKQRYNYDGYGEEEEEEEEQEASNASYSHRHHDSDMKNSQLFY
jgi:hypothetical protein